MPVPRTSWIAVVCVAAVPISGRQPLSVLAKFVVVATSPTPAAALTVGKVGADVNFLNYETKFNKKSF